MMTPKALYRKLKRQARQLLLNGDLERYLRTLRELHELRGTVTGRMA